MIIVITNKNYKRLSVNDAIGFGRLVLGEDLNILIWGNAIELTIETIAAIFMQKELIHLGLWMTYGVT